jgi:uncharacterized protein
MSKIVILAIAIAAALWLLRGFRKRSKDEAPPFVPPDANAEAMVRCARCGVHLPRGEAVMSQQRFFCSAEHEREFDRTS